MCRGPICDSLIDVESGRSYVGLSAILLTMFSTFLVKGSTVSGTTQIPIIPTLDTAPILTDPRDILGYVLRYYTTSAKSVSDSTAPGMISFMDDISRYQNDPSLLCNEVTKSLQSVYGRFFDPRTTTILVTSGDNGDGTYNITIQLSVIQNGSSYTLGADVTVSKTGILQLKWHPLL